MKKIVADPTDIKVVPDYVPISAYNRCRFGKASVIFIEEIELDVWKKK